MKKTGIVLLTVLFVVISVSAANANTVREDCGCGLGAVAVGEKEGLFWNLLGTCLNGISGNQTFGMTSGTLDCGKTDSMAKLDKMNIYVSDNMDSLAVDIAQGSGESLDALAEIAEIPNAKKQALYSALQNNFQLIYSNADVTHKSVVDKINQIINTI